MYEKHFGLKSKPFGSKADGVGVFVGPQQAKIIASLQKGLGAPDAVVTVTGPAGVGKTTIVNRALETLPSGRTAAQIGRMHLTPAEVIDLLMAGFGIKQSQQGSIRRYAAFRRLLQQQSYNEIPVAIVIEDAQRLGAEALAEVEALTAADTADAASGNIILMGHPELHDMLSTPALARLKQRIRLRQKVTALSLAEVQGYLKHSIREAGGDYDSLFDGGVAEIVYGCSEGVPRSINTLCEIALTTAMEEQSARVTSALMNRVAADAFGYEGGDAEPTFAEGASEPAKTAPLIETPTAAKATTVTEDDIDWEAPSVPEVQLKPSTDISVVDDAAEIGRDIVVESGCYQTITDIAPEETVQQVKEDVDGVPIDDTNMHAIPELINDTQPELRELPTLTVDEAIDIPVLDPRAHSVGDQGDSPANDNTEADIASQETIAKPEGTSADDAKVTTPDIKSVEKTDDMNDGSSEEEFDLDAALSPEVDETNVMPGLTPNFDALANEGRQADTDSPVPKTEPEPEPDSAPETAAKADAEDDSLPTLSSEMRVDISKEAAGSEKPEAVILPKPEPAMAPKAEPVSTPEATANAAAIQDPSRTTFDANRIPDIDALEAALAAAKNSDLGTQNGIPSIQSVTGAAPKLSADKVPAPIPEITLNDAIRDQQVQSARLDKFREEIGSASSLEDISDLTAETLFGSEEFDQIAAAVIANPARDHEPGLAESEASPVLLTNAELPSAANDSTKKKRDEDLPVSGRRDRRSSDNDVPLNESAALRIDMLNAMKSKAAKMAENVELGDDKPLTAKGPQPEPIELQINTSITQTLEALKVSRVAKSDVSEKSEKKSSGLFSRFKKSS